MKKTALIAMAMLVLSNVAFAKFSDDYKAQYPKNVTVNNKQENVNAVSKEVEKDVQVNCIVLNMDRLYHLSYPELKKFEGIIVNGMDASQVASKTDTASQKEAANVIGEEKMYFHKKQIMRLDAGKVLYDDELAEYNKYKVVVNDIFVRNYQKALSPFAEKLGAKLIINNKYVEGETKFDPYQYMGMYMPRKGSRDYDYEHQRFNVFDKKDSPNIVFRYFENVMPDSRYPWIQTEVSPNELKEMIKSGATKTIKMGTYGGYLNYIMEIQFRHQYNEKKVIISVKPITPSRNGNLWDINTRNLELYQNEEL